MLDHSARLSMRIIFLLLAILVFTSGLWAHGSAQSIQNAGRVVLLPMIISPGSQVRQVEWTLHKSSDGQHPDGNEQQLVWLMNHARANPPQEGQWLTSTNEQEIAFPRGYFKVNLTTLKNEFNGYAARPPAAFDARMYKGSKTHSDALILRDTQDHNNQFQEIADAGFSCWGGRANVFAYASSALNTHGAFNVDWASGTADGMQNNRDHRKAVMALDGNFTNVGFAIVPAPESNKIGPQVTSAAYCYARPDAPNHFNRFIVGSVWADGNGNGRYDPGEGLGGVRVSPNLGNYFAVTGAAGGYAIPVTAPGNYTIKFTGSASGEVRVAIGDTSVLVDLQVPAQ